jgi:hypothetical protein
MEIFEYSYEDPTYYFSYTAGDHLIAILMMTNPIIIKSEIHQFLKILSDNVWGKIVIKNDMDYALTITNGYGICSFDYRVPGTKFVTQLAIKHELCVKPLKEFFKDLFDLDFKQTNAVISI